MKKLFFFFFCDIIIIFSNLNSPSDEWCDPNNGQCEKCVSDNDCGVDEGCWMPLNKCTDQCSDHNDCSLSTFCSNDEVGADGLCVECTKNSHCGQDESNFFYTFCFQFFVLYFLKFFFILAIQLVINCWVNACGNVLTIMIAMATMCVTKADVCVVKPQTIVRRTKCAHRCSNASTLRLRELRLPLRHQ